MVYKNMTKNRQAANDQCSNTAQTGAKPRSRTEAGRVCLKYTYTRLCPAQHPLSIVVVKVSPYEGCISKERLQEGKLCGYR